MSDGLGTGDGDRMSSQALPASYFERMYAADPDPWEFATRWYEQRKYNLTLSALPRQRFRSGFEPGCSIGVLTELLAQRCGHLVATDVVDSALKSTRERLAHSAVGEHVELRRWALGERWPAETFDLVVLSEVGYYLDRDSLRAALDAAADALEPGGTLLCAHWRHPVVDYPLRGDQVHDLARATDGLTLTAGYQDHDLLIDVFAAGDPSMSVAQRDGLVR